MAKSRNEQSVSHYLAQLRRYPSLSRDEERRIVARHQAGDAKAGEELVCRSLWHVIYVARRYLASGEPFEDLVAEGNLALLHALRKYDPKHGTRFGTYARLWIRAYLTRYVRRGRSLVSTPLHEHAALLAKIRQERRKLGGAVGEATDEIIAKRLGVTRELVALVEHRFSQRDVSFDMPVDQSAAGLHELLPSPAPGPHDVASTRQLEGLLGNAIASSEMPDAERLIVKRRLMSPPGDEPSLAQLARELQISREWARRLEKRGLAKLDRALEGVRQRGQLAAGGRIHV